MTAICGLKLEACRFLDAEMAYAQNEAKQIEFTEEAQTEWVKRHMLSPGGAYDKAREMEASGAADP